MLRRQTGLRSELRQRIRLSKKGPGEGDMSAGYRGFPQVATGVQLVPSGTGPDTGLTIEPFYAFPVLSFRKREGGGTPLVAFSELY